MTTNSLLTGAACILLIQFISTLAVGLLGIKFPPALLGMIILAILLLLKTVRISTVEDTCTLLLEKMGMLFVPAGVSILLYAVTTITIIELTTMVAKIARLSWKIVSA